MALEMCYPGEMILKDFYNHFTTTVPGRNEEYGDSEQLYIKINNSELRNRIIISCVTKMHTTAWLW